MGRLQPATARVARYNLQNFMDYVAFEGGKFSAFTPDQLIEYQKAADNGKRFEILDLAQRWIIKMDGRFSYKKSRLTHVRSFFLHNRGELPRDLGFKIHGDLRKVVAELKPEEIKTTILSCNKVYRALYLSMFQGAMDEERLTYWSTHGLDKLREDLREKPKIIRVDLPGRKGNEENYYTLLGKDAIDALETWLVERPGLIEFHKRSKPEFVDKGAIFIDQFGDSISKPAIQLYWRAHMRRLGLAAQRNTDPRNRTGKSVHELRDSFRTLWSFSKAAAHVGEYLMGHTIDDLGYDKSPKNEKFVRAEYEKAVKYLNLLSSGNAFGLVSEDELEGLRRQLEEAKQGQNDRVAELKNEVDRLKSQESEFTQIRAEFKKLKDDFLKIEELRKLEEKEDK
jgi:integrase